MDLDVFELMLVILWKVQVINFLCRTNGGFQAQGFHIYVYVSSTVISATAVKLTKLFATNNLKNKPHLSW